MPEYSRSLEEPDILENAFQIVFAFDEIVALGYRENVNLAQIRYHLRFNELDSFRMLDHFFWITYSCGQM